ncbi:winged helix-turn-helix domain-containing protein [Nocardiopsis nanhaiensis]
MCAYFLPSEEPDQVVTVQQDYESDTPMDTHHLEPGQSRIFGRGGQNRDVDVRVAVGDRAVSRLAGDIVSYGDHWRISNRSKSKSYIVENTERLAGFLQVPPSTYGMLVPFETSRVLIPGSEGEHSFLVMAPAACNGVIVPGIDQTIPGTDPGDPESEHTDAASFRIDRWHTYYRVLVAFCEPRLRAARHGAAVSGSAVDPTQQQVADRVGLKKSAVNAHVDYLLKTKFQIEPEEVRQGRDWRSQLLIDKALQFGVVTKDDLSLLAEGKGSP